MSNTGWFGLVRESLKLNGNYITRQSVYESLLAFHMSLSCTVSEI